MKEFEKLKLLHEEAHKHKYSIYNIHFCNAGVGIQFYDWNKHDKLRISSEDDGHWKEECLFTNKYYSTAKEAIVEETKRLQEKKL
jgi:hypothetical protein